MLEKALISQGVAFVTEMQQERVMHFVVSTWT